MLDSAGKAHVALGGFDAFNMESAQAIVSVAEELSAPVFLQVSIPSAQHMGLEMAGRIALEARRNASVDVCVHLDHGPEPAETDVLRNAIEAGFESIMVDGSSLPFDENVRLTADVVAFAHARGVCVEAELGRVSRNVNASREELEALMTNPEEAGRFVESTGIDYLAVSVGSISGKLEGGVTLDLERLKRIRNKVAVPLVFHGGTGIPVDQLQEAIRLGVSKVNIAHGFRKAFLDGMLSYVGAHPQEIDPRKVLKEGRVWAESFLRKKIRQLRCLPD
jgi:fructose-bisphosphate aldolase class II